MDNRGLSPPEPMLRTMEAVEKLPNGGVLEVLVDREPLIRLRRIRGNLAGNAATHRRMAAA